MLVKKHTMIEKDGLEALYGLLAQLPIGVKQLYVDLNNELKKTKAALDELNRDVSISRLTPETLRFKEREIVKLTDKINALQLEITALLNNSINRQLEG
jgi:hypothetical protein